MESEEQSSLENLGFASRPKVMHFTCTITRTFYTKYSKVCTCECWFLCGSSLAGTFCNYCDELYHCYVLSKRACTFADRVLICRQIIFTKCFWMPLHGSCMSRRDSFLLLGVNEDLAGVPVPALEHEVSLKWLVLFKSKKKASQLQRSQGDMTCWFL